MSLTDKSRIEINPLRDFRYVAIATRYACGSICLLLKRGIYLISNWSEATIYRVRAKREHIESAKPTYRQKKKESKSTGRKLLIFLLFFCLYIVARSKGVHAYAALRRKNIGENDTVFGEFGLEKRKYLCYHIECRGVPQGNAQVFLSERRRRI